MPFVAGKWMPPRAVPAVTRKQQNGGLAATYLALEWLNQEFEESGGDWDKVIGTLRELRGEPISKRRDEVPGGYNGMAQGIQILLKKFRAH